MSKPWDRGHAGDVQTTVLGCCWRASSQGIGLEASEAASTAGMMDAHG